MSHMTVEYSGNLRDTGRFRELCAKLAGYMVELRVDGKVIFPAGGVRVRAAAFDDYCIADGSLADAAFVHAVLKIGAGRSEAVKTMTCNALFDIMKRHFADLHQKQGMALSLELYEFSEAGTLKHSNLHALLKQLSAGAH